MINDKQIASLIKKIQKKVDIESEKRKTKNPVVREVYDEDPSLEVFNEMKKRPHT